MNYIELIKQFWQCNNEIPIGCNATALYFYLLKVCNSLGWKETFKHSDRHIAIQLGISINTVRTAKNKLKQLGLIDFKSPEKASKGLDGSTRYTIQTISNFDSVPDTDIDMVSDSVPDMVSDTRNKLNYISISLKENERFVLESLNPLMEEFLNDPIIIEDFQRSIGTPYPSIETIKDLIKEFFVKLTVDGEATKERKDAIYHFKSWYRQDIESKSKRKSHEQTQKTGTAAGFKQFR